VLNASKCDPHTITLFQSNITDGGICSIIKEEENRNRAVEGVHVYAVCCGVRERQTDLGHHHRCRDREELQSSMPLIVVYECDEGNIHPPPHIISSSQR
jgi:hypothetical protein